MRSIRFVLPCIVLLAACDTKAKEQLATLARVDSLRVDSIVSIKNDLLNEVMTSTQFVNSLNEEMAKLLVPTYTQSFKLTWPIGWSPRIPVYDYLERPQLYQLFMPTIVFIDKKWNIRAQHIGNEDFFKDEEKNMRKMIETLLAESSSGAPRAAAKKKAS